MDARRAVTAEMAKRYSKGSKKEKGRLLGELSALTGRSRRQARRALHQAIHRTGPPPERSRPRAMVYGQDLQAPLVTVWAVLGGLCGKRMAPFMGEAVAALERFSDTAPT